MTGLDGPAADRARRRPVRDEVLPHADDELVERRPRARGSRRRLVAGGVVAARGARLVAGEVTAPACLGQAALARTSRGRGAVEVEGERGHVTLRNRPTTRPSTRTSL